MGAHGLTSLFDEHGLDEIDFVKMDIEGAEAVVFHGPLDWLQRVRAIKIELHEPMTYDVCATLLAREGFDCRHDDREAHGLVAIKRGLQRPYHRLPVPAESRAQPHNQRLQQ